MLELFLPLQLEGLSAKAKVDLAYGAPCYFIRVDIYCFSTFQVNQHGFYMKDLQTEVAPA